MEDLEFLFVLTCGARIAEATIPCAASVFQLQSEGVDVSETILC